MSVRDHILEHCGLLNGGFVEGGLLTASVRSYLRDEKQLAACLRTLPKAVRGERELDTIIDSNRSLLAFVRRLAKDAGRALLRVRIRQKRVGKAHTSIYGYRLI